MTKSAATTMRQIAERRVAALLRASNISEIALAPELVAIVFDTLREPDRDMAEAGRRELELAVPPEMRQKAYVRQLAAAVWRTMFAEAGR
jgi:hypothetical protein